MSVLQLRSGQEIVSIEDSPLCTFDELNQVQVVVDERMPDFFDLLPADHMWRKKLDHVTITPHVVLPLFSKFKGNMCAENYKLLMLIYNVHDLGRVLEGCNKSGIEHGYPEFKHHGEGSVKVLRAWGIHRMIRPKVWEVIEYAILNHVGSHTPYLATPRNQAGDMRYFFTAMLRDIDKLDTFRDTTAKYLYFQRKKNQEFKQHGFAEWGLIIPAHFLDDFEKHLPLDRRQIVSYEAYMLYFMSWIYDVNLREVVEMIIESDAIHWLMQYFQERLDADTYGRIQQTIKTYLQETYDIELA